MKRFILATAAVALCASCKLGDLGYNPSMSNSVLSNLANEMAHDCITLPIYAINSFDRSKTDIFAEGFQAAVDCEYNQKVSITKVEGADSTWNVSTLSSTDKISFTITLKMLPSAEKAFDLWTSGGTCRYDEGNGYSAKLDFTGCKYSWKDNMSSGSYYQKYLVVNGICNFKTMLDNKDVDSGALTLLNDKVSTTSRLSGILRLR